MFSNSFKYCLNRNYQPLEIQIKGKRGVWIMFLGFKNRENKFDENLYQKMAKERKEGENIQDLKIKIFFDNFKKALIL